MIKIILLKACYKAYSITREPIDVLLILLAPLCIVSILDVSQRIVNLVSYSVLVLQLLWLILVAIVLIDRRQYIEYVWEDITELDTFISFIYEKRIMIVTRSGSYWVDQATYDLLNIALNIYRYRCGFALIIIPKKAVNIPTYAERAVNRRLKYESVKLPLWYLRTLEFIFESVRDWRSYGMVKEYIDKNEEVLYTIEKNSKSKNEKITKDEQPEDQENSMFFFLLILIAIVGTMVFVGSVAGKLF